MLVLFKGVFKGVETQLISPCWSLTPAQKVFSILATKPKTPHTNVIRLEMLHLNRHKLSSKSGRFLPGRRKRRLVVASEERVNQVVQRCRRPRLSRMEREPISPAEIDVGIGKPAGRQKKAAGATVTLRW